MTNEVEIIKKINQLYIMTRSQYLIMQNTGKYTTFNVNKSANIRKLNDYTVKRHLDGVATLGVFAGVEFTKFICFDVDVPDMKLAKWTTYKLINGLIEIGIPSNYIYVSHSGNKGYHVEIFLSNPIKCKQAYKLYLTVLNHSDLLNMECGEVEFRPNSTKQGVKIPLGVHFKTNKRCWYVDHELQPIKDMEYILNIEQLDVEYFYNILDEQEDIYIEETVSKVEETRQMIESKVKPLESYKQNVNEDETIDSIKKLLFEGLTIQGTRNNALFKLAKYFHYQGMEQDVCKEMLIEWMGKQDKSLYTTSWEQCLKDIEHIHDYVYKNDIQLTVNHQELTVDYHEMLQIIQLKTKNEKILAYCMLIHSKRFATQKNIFYMTYNQMEVASGLVNKTCRTVVNKLEQNGILIIVERNRKQQGTYKKKPNKYKLNIGAIVEEDCNEFKIVCNDINYANSFKECLVTLFDTNDIKKMLPRRQYESIINM